jgi:uncharacterized protein
MQPDSRPRREVARTPHGPRGALPVVPLCLAFALAACGGPPRPLAPPSHVAATRAEVRAELGPRGDDAPASEVTTSTADSDADGIPDSAELRTHADRESFRRWFTAIAEAQFYEPSREWNEGQRDCAGLVRFAWREALRRHDRRWLARMGPAYEQVAPDVRAYTLERGPLGEKIFRASFGSFRESDLRDATFSEFADARTLRSHNVEFVSRDTRRAEPGDLLFFFQHWQQKYPFHVMIFLGPARAASEGASDWVVYHTGAAAADAGTVKKVRLAVLREHPDARWRPVERNRNFQGVFRLKILQ